MLLSWMGAADDVDCALHPCHRECVPPGVQLTCVPQERHYVKPFIPLVEGQRLIYLNSSKSPYDQVQQSMIQFFRDWAKSCPGDKAHPQPAARPNDVTVQQYIEPHSGTLVSLTNSVTMVRPQSVIVQYTFQGKTFSAEYWTKLLNRIPKKTGCLIMAPLMELENARAQEELRQLKALIVKINHSCQVIDAREEMLSHPVDCNAFRRATTSWNTCEVNGWSKQIQQKLCGVDPRTFIDREESSEPSISVESPIEN